MNMIMGKIILRGSVGNNSNQPYPVNDLAIIVSTFLLRSCYYSLMKINTVIYTSLFNTNINNYMIFWIYYAQEKKNSLTVNNFSKNIVSDQTYYYIRGGVVDYVFFIQKNRMHALTLIHLRTSTLLWDSPVIFRSNPGIPLTRTDRGSFMDLQYDWVAPFGGFQQMSIAQAEI